MDFESLAPELKEKAKACKSEEDLKELAEAVGAKLSEEQLGGVAGGAQADICRKDHSCQVESLRPPCPAQGCPELLDDLIQKCTDLEPAECTKLIYCEDVFPCGILKTS